MYRSWYASLVEEDGFLEKSLDYLQQALSIHVEMTNTAENSENTDVELVLLIARVHEALGDFSTALRVVSGLLLFQTLLFESLFL